MEVIFMHTNIQHMEEFKEINFKKMLKNKIRCIGIVQQHA